MSRRDYYDEGRDQILPIPARPNVHTYQQSPPQGYPASPPIYQTSPPPFRSEPPSPAVTRAKIRSTYQKFAKPKVPRQDSSNKWSVDDDGTFSPIKRSTTYPTGPPSDWADASKCGPDCPLRTHVMNHLQDDGLRPYMEANPPSPEVLQASSKRLYQPLRPWQTRIIELRPDEYEKQLKCVLTTVEFIDMEGVGVPGTSQTIKYEALSYAWGTGAQTATIVCNGILWAIGPNLAGALRYLRHETQPRYIWCDAICINQSDPAEKAQQVRNMLRIFEKADRVIAWIGSAIYLRDTEARQQKSSYNETKVLFNALNHDRVVESMLHDDFSQPGPHRKECGKFANAIYGTLMEHCDRLWFGRIWVRQEVFAAKQIVIQCGADSVDFDKFLDLMFKLVKAWSRHAFSALNPQSSSPTLLQQAPELLVPARSCATLQSDFRHAGTDRHEYQPPRVRRRYTTHWLRTLQDGTDFDVTDPRDRVYGALGMIQSASNRWYVEDRPEIRAAEFPIDYGKTIPEVYQDVIKFLINTDENLDALQVFESRKGRSVDLPFWVPDWRKDLERSFLKAGPNRQTELRRLHSPMKQNLSGKNLSLEGMKYGEINFIDARTPINRATLKSFWPPLHKMDEDFEKVMSDGSFVLAETASMKHIVPRNTIVDDIVVALKGAQCLFLLRKLSDGSYRFLGPVCTWRGLSQSSTGPDDDVESEWKNAPIPAWDQVGDRNLEGYVIV